MENDVKTLMNIFQGVNDINFEYLRKPHQGNFLFIRDGRYVVRFIFDEKDNLSSLKIIDMDNRELSKKED